MNLANYFENINGTGILATADSDGNVDLAIYSKPEVIDESTICFNMLQRLSYANIQSNPKAAYMFVEKGASYEGKRLYLTKIHEEADAERITEIKKKHPKIFSSDEVNKHKVFFNVENVRPLVDDNL